ncbi:hypothetical protein ABGT23_01690 [Enterobacter cloacae]|uniref:MrpH family fimbial adhesin n=1 Tax=Enterobacter cloacae TaxID=550 RepID=UPI00345D7A8E
MHKRPAPMRRTRTHTQKSGRDGLYAIAIFFLMLPQFVYADAWKVYVTHELTPNNYHTYTLRITDWDFSSTLPNPLYGCDITAMPCEIALTTGTGQDYAGTSLKKSKDVVSAKTIGELGLVMQRKGIWFGKTHVKTFQNSNVCSRPGYMKNGGAYTTLPGGTCTFAELPPTTCSFDMPSLELRHVEYDKNANGSRASANINVTCTEAMKVRIKGQHSGVDSIVLDSKTNFESVLTLNDKPLSTGVDVNASIMPTTVTVTSTLKGTPPPGEYQGSTAIIISLP